jgi:tRNA(Ile)-lysidine synthase TilS/MesJ
MKANYKIDAGDVRVIRPLVYVREKATRDFSKTSKLPVVNENCPACFEEPKERARVKKILEQEEAMVPALFFNIRKAMLPLLHERTYEVMKEVEEIINRTSSARVVVKRGRAAEMEADMDPTLSDVNNCGVDSAELSKKKSKVNFLDTTPAGFDLNIKCEDDYCVPCFELM